MPQSDLASAGTTLDVITIGRSSVDLYGQQLGTRLEDTASFAKSVGGCPANIASGTLIASLAFGPGLTACGALFRKCE